MTDTEIKLITGGLLHDIGKLIFRQGNDKRGHSDSGYEFLKNAAGMADDCQELLDAVRYHHADALEGAQIECDSLAYVIHAANHIVSAAERRKDGQSDAGADIHMPLQSIFNRLNGNEDTYCYAPGVLYTADHVRCPTTERKPLDQDFYQKILGDIKDSLYRLKECSEDLCSGWISYMKQKKRMRSWRTWQCWQKA